MMTFCPFSQKTSVSETGAAPAASRLSRASAMMVIGGPWTWSEVVLCHRNPLVMSARTKNHSERCTTL